MQLPPGPYSIIYADPPWPYNDHGFGKRPDGTISGSFHPEAGRYTTMSLTDIMALPIKDSCSPDAALFLWATSPNLPMGLMVIDAWGFKFKTVAFCWSKQTTTGKQVANLGQWTMGNVELCLLGTRGRPKRFRRDIKQLVIAERTGHSRKPDEVRCRIVELLGDVPRLEMFARQRTPGWDVWGNEC